MPLDLNVELFLSKSLEELKQLKNAKTGFFSSTLDIKSAISFFIQKIDEAIKFAQANLTVGEEKKAFVMAVISRLYDETVSPFLPTYLYLFSGAIKDIIVNKLISLIVDYIVKILKDGKLM